MRMIRPFCGRQANRVIRIAGTARTNLLFALHEVFAQLLRRPRLAFRLALARLLAGASLRVGVCRRGGRLRGSAGETPAFACLS